MLTPRFHIRLSCQRLLFLLILPGLAQATEFRFNSDPAGATVRIVGDPLNRMVGKATTITTPGVLDLRSSKQPYEIEVTLAGYETLRLSVNPGSRERQINLALAPLAMEREVQFTSEPAGATVTLSGAPAGRILGRTPLAARLRFERRSSSTPWSTPEISFQMGEYAPITTRVVHDDMRPVTALLVRIAHERIRIVRVVDNLGQPISGADVMVNRARQGQTDELGILEVKLPFTRLRPTDPWPVFTIGADVPDKYLPGSVAAGYDSERMPVITLMPVTEVAVTTYFLINELTPRGPKRSVALETRIGTLNDRDLNSPATDLRPLTGFERNQKVLQAVNSFTVTPDGQSLIYGVTMQTEAGEYFSNLFQKSARQAATPVTQLTRGNRFWDTAPTMGVEEGANLLVFQSNRGVPTTWDISSFRLVEGRVVGGIVQLTRDTRFHYGPTFASEAQPVYFSSMDEYPQAEPRIASVRVDGSAYTNLGESGERLHLTPRGEIYFTRVDSDTGRRQIYRVTSDGFSFALVINDPQFVLADCYDPAISPDGRRMLFTSNYHADEKGRHNANIYLYDLADGRTPLQLTDNGSDDIQPMWSPTEPDVVYFLSNRRGIYNIWRMTFRVAQ